MKDIHHIPYAKKGFTLVEILIAVSIIAIITAIALPNFTSMIAKSKLRSDVQTVMSMQNAIDLYIAEYGESPLDTTKAGVTDTAAEVVSTLFSGGYIRSATVNLQTEGATLVFTQATRLMRIDLSGAQGLSGAIVAALSESETAFVTGTPSFE